MRMRSSAERSSIGQPGQPISVVCVRGDRWDHCQCLPGKHGARGSSKGLKSGVRLAGYAGVFSPDIGRFLLVESCILELAVAVLGTLDDPLDFVRSPDIRILQEFRSDCLLLRFWSWLLSFTSQGQSPTRPHPDDSTVCDGPIALGRIAGDDEFASGLRRSKCWDAGLGYSFGGNLSAVGCGHSGDCADFWIDRFLLCSRGTACGLVS